MWQYFLLGKILYNTITNGMLSPITPCSRDRYKTIWATKSFPTEDGRGGEQIKRGSCEIRNFLFSAERQGFEPWNRFCRLHDFQSCLFSLSSISPC